VDKIRLSLAVLKLHIPIVSVVVTVLIVALFVMLFRAGVNIILVGLVYIPAGLAFVLGSSLIVFLLALLFSNFGLKANLLKSISIVASYPITIGLALLLMRLFE